MRVQRLVAVGVENAQVVAVALMAARHAHHTVRGGQHRRALCRSQVVADVKVVAKAAHRIGAPAVAGGFTALPGQRELQWKAGRVAVRPGVGRRRRLAVSCAGALRRGGQGEVLPHAAGGVGQLPGGLLGKFQKVALLAQQQRLLGLHGRRERAAQLRVNRPIQRPGGQHKADGSKTEKDLRP